MKTSAVYGAFLYDVCIFDEPRDAKNWHCKSGLGERFSLVGRRAESTDLTKRLISSNTRTLDTEILEFEV